MGKDAEPHLTERIKQIWKTDLFLSCSGDAKFLAATVKSQFSQLEGGRGLRIGIVAESTTKGHKPGVHYSEKHGLWVATLADPNGFTGLFNEAYQAVALAICTLGKQNKPPYYTKPSAKAQKVQEQLEKYGSVRVVEVEDALDSAAQQDLISAKTKLVGVNAPDWLHLKKAAAKLIAPKPRFKKL